MRLPFLSLARPPRAVQSSPTFHTSRTLAIQQTARKPEDQPFLRKPETVSGGMPEFDETSVFDALQARAQVKRWAETGDACTEIRLDQSRREPQAAKEQALRRSSGEGDAHYRSPARSCRRSNLH